MLRSVLAMVGIVGLGLGSVALAGDYRSLVAFLSRAPVGTVFLELATPRAGELAILAELPGDKRVGVGVVNQKVQEVESVGEVLARAEKAVQLFGVDRVLRTGDRPYVDAEDGLWAVAIANALLEAAAAGHAPSALKAPAPTSPV